MANEPDTLRIEAAQSKTCSRCGDEKPETAEFFAPRKRYRNGLSKWCKPCEAAYAREWRARNPDRAKAAARQRYERNPEKHKAAVRRYIDRHPERRRETFRAYCSKKGNAYRLRNNLGAYLSAVLRRAGSPKNGSSWEDILGYTAAALIRHVERQFAKGMTWENYGEWHLDHIVPVSSFSFTGVDDPEFLACWALTNLRPMWAAENMSKGGKRTHLI